MSMQPHGIETADHSLFWSRNQHGLADCIGNLKQRHDDVDAGNPQNSAAPVYPVYVANEAGVSAADHVDMVQSRHVNVGGAFFSAHGCFLAARVVGFVPGKPNMHAGTTRSSYKSRPYVRYQQSRDPRGYGSSNTPATISSSRSAPFGGFGGNPSTPSIEADGAKMGRTSAPDRAAKAGIAPINSKHAATHSQVQL